MKQEKSIMPAVPDRFEPIGNAAFDQIAKMFGPEIITLKMIELCSSNDRRKVKRGWRIYRKHNPFQTGGQFEYRILLLKRWRMAA